MTLLRHGDSYLYFRSYFSYLSVEQLKLQIEELNRLSLSGPIYLILNTGGGSLDYLPDLYEMVVSSRRPIETIVDQETHGVGSFLALLGRTRKIIKGSCITLPNLLNHGWDMDKLFAYGNLIYQIYRKYTRMPETTRYQMMRQECRIEEREALELGLVDKYTDLPEEYQNNYGLGGRGEIGESKGVSLMDQLI